MCADVQIWMACDCYIRVLFNTSYKTFEEDYIAIHALMIVTIAMHGLSYILVSVVTVQL